MYVAKSGFLCKKLNCVMAVNLRVVLFLKLIKFRVESALEIGKLKSFLPIIENCTSDDESDQDVAPVASTSTKKP
jgi:hypothetical protein